mgnify:CR=1 FL=1
MKLRKLITEDSNINKTKAMYNLSLLLDENIKIMRFLSAKDNKGEYLYSSRNGVSYKVYIDEGNKDLSVIINGLSGITDLGIRQISFKNSEIGIKRFNSLIKNIEEYIYNLNDLKEIGKEINAFINRFDKMT